MTRLRRALGRIAVAWLLCQAATLTLVPAALSSGAVGVHALECTCSHGDHAVCPMHHKPAPGAKLCLMRSANDSGIAVLSWLLNGVGLMPAAAAIRRSRVATRPSVRRRHHGLPPSRSTRSASAPRVTHRRPFCSEHACARRSWCRFPRRCLVKSSSILALATCLVAWAHPVVAQQSVDYASVSGRVTDPSGAVVPGAQVTARHTETNVTGATATDQEGRFRFPYLRVGPYEITVAPAGIRGRHAGC